ncbi:MAG: NAD-glutamate dehydrogenase, partial [Actinomycetota bacterium]|nr:NAD-glutamate dehydrogenase [Actinomycetota bacterium]
SLGDRVDVFVRMVVQIDGPLPEPPLDDVAREVRLLCRTWDEELAACLATRMDEGWARRLARTWGDWFPASYRDARSPQQAADDVVDLEQLLGGHGSAASTVTARTGARGDGRIRIVLVPDADSGPARLKVFTAGTDVELSRFLPIIESLGLWAVEEQPFELGREDERVHLHDFAVTDPSGAPLQAGEDGPRLAEAALALWHGDAEVDSLNRLVLRADMSWQDVAVLRAYRRYRSQVGTTFTAGYVDDVLVENANITRALLELFAARFDPALDPSGEVLEQLRRRVVEACDAVPLLDHDRILRGMLALVDATVRTSRYLRPSTHITLKFDSSAVPEAPRPVPFREIFVNGPTMEGIHLRWGPVARGGIRWSERPDDYRSEVLGLMRAQVLKNAVIVPTGAKGGFVVKRGRYGRAANPGVQEAYETFITGLLDVTDNVVGETVVPVARRRDGDDPYLVVAADRGTAGFSDLANQLSEEHGFWLGDAFASGGSRGYDHKKLGITARGAWVAVRQQFAELDIDIDADGITVVGIGDMSGDVFGNGMLRSDRIQLVAAFDHRDVFLDPKPDPHASYKERARLFALPASSWQDYDRSLLSPGGGVWSRLDKRIELSPEARAVLGVEAEELSPPEVIRAILQAPVDLLFAGGIGTFVRASTEPDHEIGDRSNTEIRVPASSVRARVVGEGANLAFTQRARIEYARRGGRINTDAIDNAAGVDISDREVNLKILLRLALDAGQLTLQERDQLMTEVCDDVIHAVLRDCALQSIAIRRAQVGSPGRMGAAEALMAELEGAAVFDRAVEALPTAEEMEARAKAGAGLTRPEVAVLLAGAKRGLTAHVLHSRMLDQPAMREALVSYFPTLLATRFDHLLERHRLRRELIASVLANDVVNRMGPTFVTRLARDSGALPSIVASAYWSARGVVDASAWWRELDAHAGQRHDEAVVAARDALSELLESLTRDYLRRDEVLDIAGVIARDRPLFQQLEEALPTIGTRAHRRRRSRRVESLIDGGAEEATALRWACLSELEIGPDVAELARDTGRPVTAVAQAFLQLAESLGIDRLRERLSGMPAEDRWSRAAWRGLADDLDELRRVAVRRALEQHPNLDAGDAVREFLAGRTRRIAQLATVLSEIERDRQAPLEAVAVGTRAVSQTIR